MLFMVIKEKKRNTVYFLFAFLSTAVYSLSDFLEDKKFWNFQEYSLPVSLEFPVF